MCCVLMVCFDGVLSGCAVFCGVMMVCFDGVLSGCAVF